MEIFIPPIIYASFLKWFIWVISGIFAIVWLCPEIRQKWYNTLKIFVIIYFLLLLVLFGAKPIGPYFTSDLPLYADVFINFEYSPLYNTYIEHKEFVYLSICWIGRLFYDVRIHFFLLALLFIGSGFALSKQLGKKEWVLVFMLFVALEEFPCYLNSAIRTGLAVSFMTFAIYYRAHFLKSLLFVLLGILTHSSLIPIGAGFIVSRFYKKSKTYLAIWAVTALVCFYWGNYVMDYMTFFQSSQTDTRLFAYSGGGEEEFTWRILTIFQKYGYLLFSAIPLILWLATPNIKKNDDYNRLVNTYIVGNLFWLFFMHAPESQRFAMTSWWLWPFVCAYPITHNFFPKYGHLLGSLLLIIPYFTFVFRQIF